MNPEVREVAKELAHWLRTRPGVRDVQGPFFPTRPRTSRFPLPLPPFLAPGGGGPQPTFELRFVYKDRPRTFRYFIEQDDDRLTMLSTLQVHTNGELMVRVPDEYGQLMPNDIYYANASASGAAMGEPARSQLR